MEKQTVERLYDWLSPMYGLWAEMFETRARRRAEEVLDVRPGETLLEVGIGAGKHFSRLAQANAWRFSVGMDLSAGMLKRARARVIQAKGKPVYLGRGDADHLPFHDGMFDIILNCYMLDLLEDEQLPIVLAEFRRVLKASGRLAVINMAEQSPRFNRLWMKIYRRDPMLVGGCRPIFAGASLAKCGWQVRLHEEIRQWGFRTELVVATP